MWNFVDKRKMNYANQGLKPRCGVGRALLFIRHSDDATPSGVYRLVQPSISINYEL